MAQHSPAHRRALIVDDETLFAMTLAEDMHGLGFGTCDLAADGEEAFLHAMEDQPDIVLMDVNLRGGREGIEAARWLREVCDIPVVFVTAYTDSDTVKRIREQVPGAPVLAKPLDRQHLAKAVAELEAPCARSQGSNPSAHIDSSRSSAISNSSSMIRARR
jgi:CheY-like chemotaxis protein